MDYLDRFGKKQKKQPSKTMVQRMKLYKDLKSQGKNVEWKSTSVAQLKKSLITYSDEANMTKIYNFVAHAQSRRLDARNLRSIQALPIGETLEMPISQFNRIIGKINAGADRYMFIHTKDEYGSIKKSVSLHNNQFGNNIFVTLDEGSVSDADIAITDIALGSVEMEWLPAVKHQRKRSEFFRYFTHEYFQLEDFQVYNEGTTLGEDSEIPCFLFALEQAGVPQKTISSLSSTMFTFAATHDFIRKSAEAFNLHIELKTFKESETRFDFSKSSYGDKSLPAIELACVGSHLFAIKETKVSSYALNYPQFASNAAWPAIEVKNGRVKKNSNPKLLMSHQVIGHLYFNREKMLQPITLQNAPKLLNNKYAEIDSLDNFALNKQWFKEIGLKRVEVGAEVYKEGEKFGVSPFTTKVNDKFVDDEFEVVYFDLETFSDATENIAKRFPEVASSHTKGEHVAYCASWKIGNNPTQHAFGMDCVKTMLDSFPPEGNYLMFAHNAGFDTRFLIRQLSSFDTRAGIIENGNSMKQLVGTYEGRRIMIKDTMSFINARLAAMPAMFPGACDETTLEKESFPHDLMNTKSFDSLLCLDLIKSEFADAENLIANATKINAIKDNCLDVQKYASHYCDRDVDVLASCFERFREMFMTRFNQDVYRHISMPGLAYAILNNDGCYDGCYSMAGPCLSFVRKAIVGGRVMTRDNVKHHTTHEVVDFDAVSLYPSAMARLEGFAKGKPLIHRETIPECHYHISKVKITSLATERHFPLQSTMKRTESTKVNAAGNEVKSVSEARDFSNDIVGKTIILDQYALEDLVHFQGVTYEVIEGLYWNDGFNTTINDSITKLFQERLRLKDVENPLQEGIKLLINSSYGKLIQKPIIKQKTIIRGKDAIRDYTIKRINRLIQRTPISDDICLFEEHKPLSKHFSPAHLGVQILSMSKRIMNEVMCLAEDQELDIWYQDTDSMHIDRSSLDQLTEFFKLKYGRDLVGKGLGQFHSDFALAGCPNKVDIYAYKSYFIGKKTYVDFLRADLNRPYVPNHFETMKIIDGVNVIEGVHKRMKGIPSKLITDPSTTYKDLFDGKDQTFDLAKACPIQINNKTQRVCKRVSFPRVVRAPKN